MARPATILATRDYVCACLLLLTFLCFPAVSFAQQPVQVNVGPPQPRITSAVDEARLTTLAGNTHPMARAAFDRGAAPSTLPMERMLLVLKRSPDQEGALDTLLEQQQDRSSPNYHRWLTPQQFGQQFGPADQDIQAITSWLQSHGFQVTRVSNGRTVIEFTGTAGQVLGAFHTEIHRYTVNGEDHWANSRDPQIPEALAPVVAGINTLYNFPRRPMHHLGGAVTRAKDTKELVPVEPFFTFGGLHCGLPGFFCYGLGPYDFATIYNVSPLWNGALAHIDGAGQTIAIVGETDISIQDVRNFRNVFGLAANDPHIIVDGPDPGTSPADETESDLDVEWAGAVAKGAAVDLVVSESTEASLGVDLSAQYIVDNNLAPILSESYGICELFLGNAGNQFYNHLWQQAAAQGITVLVASGDSGSAVCDRNAGTEGAAQFGLSVSGISSTPFNVAVGGTDFNDLTSPATYWSSTNSAPPGAPTGTPATVSALSYIPETTWNNSCTNAVFGNLLGYSTNAETNCNNSTLQQDGFVAAVGGTGGKSNCISSNGGNPSNCTQGYSKPSWQTALTPNDGARDVPDVSLFAAVDSPSGAFYLICQADLIASGFTSCDASDSNTRYLAVGGTSASTPSFAGIMAMVNQATGSRQGNANSILYKLAAQSGASCNSSNGAGTGCVFYDVTNGTIAMPCVKNSPNCTISNSGDSVGVLSGYSTATGYDLATGLGSVNASNLVNNWTNFSLTPSSTTLSLDSGAAINIMHGQSVSVNISVTGTGGTPSGNVSLIANTGTSGEEGVQGFSLAGGSASGTTHALPGGSYTVFAQYPGDGTFGSSSSTPAVAVAVSAETSKTFASLLTFDINGNLIDFGASTVAYGSGYYLLRMDVGDSGASVSTSTGVSSNCSKSVSNCPTGTLTVTSNGSPFAGGMLPLNSQGYAEVQSLATGTYAISVSYPGDSSYGPSAGSTNFTVSKAPTTVQAGVAGLPVEYGDDEQITGTLLTTSDGIAPTGTFSFFLDGSPLPVSSVVNEGFPYQPGASPPFATLSTSGSATFLSLGSHSLSVQYSGDSNYSPATSLATTIMVTKAQPSFSTFGATPGTVNVNQQTSLTAQMAGSDAGVAPTGTMTFFVDSVAVSGTIAYTPTAHGLSATLSYTPTVVGSHSVTVSYSGDTNYLSAMTPTAAALTVTGPTFTVTANPTTISVPSPGQMGSTVLTFTGQNGFSSNGSVTLSPAMCSVLPSESSCSFSPSTITLTTNGTAMITLTVLTTAPSALLPNLRKRPGGNWPALFAFVALPVLLVLYSLRSSHKACPVFRTAAAVLVFGLLLAISACGGGGGGGGGGNPGTPAPSNTPISVTIAINGVTQTVPNLFVNVQ